MGGPCAGCITHTCGTIMRTNLATHAGAEGMGWSSRTQDTRPPLERRPCVRRLEIRVTSARVIREDEGQRPSSPPRLLRPGLFRVTRLARDHGRRGAVSQSCVGRSSASSHPTRPARGSPSLDRGLVTVCPLHSGHARSRPVLRRVHAGSSDPSLLRRGGPSASSREPHRIMRPAGHAPGNRASTRRLFSLPFGCDHR